jgi:hypothetical protein
MGSSNLGHLYTMVHRAINGSVVHDPLLVPSITCRPERLSAMEIASENLIAALGLGDACALEADDRLHLLRHWASVGRLARTGLGLRRGRQDLEEEMVEAEEKRWQRVRDKASGLNLEPTPETPILQASCARCGTTTPRKLCGWRWRGITWQRMWTPSSDNSGRWNPLP